MLQSAYRKEWLVGACMGREFLGMSVGARIPTITEYADIFSCSRGIIQNALAQMEEENVIRLDRQGKRGTFLIEKNERALFISSGLRHLTASMPPPVNLHFAGLATGICHQMSSCPVPFTFAFVQGARNRAESLASGAYDFVVTTRYSAERFTCEYPEIEIAFPFEGCRYASPHKLYINHPGLTELQDGMTIAVDPASSDMAALTRKICQGKNVEIREMPFVSALYGFYSGQIDAILFRDSLKEPDDNLLRILTVQKKHISPEKISEIQIPEGEETLEQAVALIHRENYGIRGILGKFLLGDQVGKIQQKVMDGSMLPQFY